MAMEKESMECALNRVRSPALDDGTEGSLYGMSYFYERAQAAKAVRWPNSETKAVKITPSDYKRAEEESASTSILS